MSTAMSFNDGGTASLFPQEQTHKKKRRFSVKEKLCLVRQVKRRIDQDKVSIRTACRDLNIGFERGKKEEFQGEKSLLWPCIDFETS
jgi:hypothetical protein